MFLMSIIRLNGGNRTIECYSADCISCGFRLLVLCGWNWFVRFQFLWRQSSFALHNAVLRFICMLYWVETLISKVFWPWLFLSFQSFCKLILDSRRLILILYLLDNFFDSRCIAALLLVFWRACVYDFGVGVHLFSSSTLLHNLCNSQCDYLPKIYHFGIHICL